MKKGLASCVVDGCVRDLEELEKINFPVFAKDINLRGPYKDGPGKINVPIAYGGCVVMLGDIVIGDKDGVAIIPLEEAEVVLNKVKDVFNFEEETSKKINSGT